MQQGADEPRDRADHLERDDALGVPSFRAPGEQELLGDAVARVERRDAASDPARAADERDQHALAEALRAAPAPGGSADATPVRAADLVLQQPDGPLAFGAGRVEREPDEHDREEDACDREEEPDLRHRYPRSSSSRGSRRRAAMAAPPSMMSPTFVGEQQHDVVACSRRTCRAPIANGMQREDPRREPALGRSARGSGGASWRAHGACPPRCPGSPPGFRRPRAGCSRRAPPT